MAVAERRPPPCAQIPAGGARVRRDLAKSIGRPLDAALRRRMEARVATSPTGLRLGHRGLEAAADRAARGGEAGAGERRAMDFSTVRLHADSHAASAARRFGARAFTIGEHVYADPSLLPAGLAERDSLMAHELAHVAQQRQLGRTLIQPRLIATGSTADIQRFIALAEPAMGERLQHDAATHAISVIGPFPSSRISPAFAAALHRIIDDSHHDAEILFGVDQPGVAVGMFPDPPDLTGADTRQRVDIDDIEAIETALPGHGLAFLAHELSENYQAHLVPAASGQTRFLDAHQSALQTEGDVAEQIVGPGRPVAEATSRVGDVVTAATDYGSYYVVVVFQSPPIASNAPANALRRVSVTAARRATRVNVLQLTIDGYATGSSQIPATAATKMTQVRNALTNNPLATARIEGFTDNVPGDNLTLSHDRAEDVRFELEASVQVGGPATFIAGLDRLRMHIIGSGEARPVAPNDTEANRAKNRRVIITVDQPAAAATGTP